MALSLPILGQVLQAHQTFWAKTFSAQMLTGLLEAIESSFLGQLCLG